MNNLCIHQIHNITATYSPPVEGAPTGWLTIHFNEGRSNEFFINVFTTSDDIPGTFADAINDTMARIRDDREEAREYLYARPEMERA